MVDTYEGRKPMASWWRPPGLPSQHLAQQGAGGCQRSTAIYAVEIWDARDHVVMQWSTRTTQWWWWWKASFWFSVCWEGNNSFSRLGLLTRAIFYFVWYWANTDHMVMSCYFFFSVGDTVLVKWSYTVRISHVIICWCRCRNCCCLTTTKKIQQLMMMIMSCGYDTNSLVLKVLRLASCDGGKFFLYNNLAFAKCIKY